MKITVHGPRAGYGPGGMIDSWAPDQEVEVDDSDKKAVAWARMFVATGAADLVEDVPVKETRAPARQAGGRP
jgi:hypothetical protein